MTRATLLTALWTADGEPDKVAADTVKALESGELELTGSFRNWRNEENEDFWHED